MVVFKFEMLADALMPKRKFSGEEEMKAFNEMVNKTYKEDG